MAYDKVVDSAVLEEGLKKVGDSIRAKAGTSALLEFPDAMSAAVDAIDTSENLDEVLTEQESIIDQIQAALEGKAAPSVETCTVTIIMEDELLLGEDGVYYIDAEQQLGEVKYGGIVSISVMKNSIITFAYNLLDMSGSAICLNIKSAFVNGDASFTIGM